MLTKLDDQSVLSGGANPDKDTFTFVARTDLPKIRAVRLEALTHESLANGGPGRSPWGNFALSSFTVATQPQSGADDGATALKLVNPQADFEQSGYPAKASLDGNPGTAWSIDPRYGRDHAVVYEVDPTQQTGFEGGAKLHLHARLSIQQ